MKCLVWSVALYAAETWTLTQTDRRRLESFEMWIWRRMEKISWLDKVTNEEVLRRVNDDRQILNSLWQRKHRWIDLVLRHGGLTHGITEGRMKGKLKKKEFKYYMIWQMMVALLHSNGQLRTERDGDTEKGCQKPAVEQKSIDAHFISNTLQYQHL